MIAEAEECVPEAGSIWLHNERLVRVTVKGCWTTIDGDRYVELAGYASLTPLESFLWSHKRIFMLGEGKESIG